MELSSEEKKAMDELVLSPAVTAENRRWLLDKLLLYFLLNYWVGVMRDTQKDIVCNRLYN